MSAISTGMAEAEAETRASGAKSSGPNVKAKALSFNEIERLLGDGYQDAMAKSLADFMSSNPSVKLWDGKTPPRKQA